MKQDHDPQCKHLLGCLSEYVDGALQPELCKEIEEHMRNCENCRIVVNTMRKTVELYEQSSEMEQNLPDSVRERLFVRLDLNDFLHQG